MVMPPDFPSEPVPEPTPEEKGAARDADSKARVEAFALERLPDPSSDLIGKLCEQVRELQLRVSALEKP